MLLKDYLAECAMSGIYSVRIIHGKGTGALARTVRSCLSKNQMVISFSQAPPEAGGWGATLAQLKKQDKQP